MQAFKYAGLRAAVLVFLMATGNVIAQQAPADNAAPNDQFRERICEIVLEGSKMFSGKIEDLEKELGKPLNTEVHKVQNIHDPDVTDELHRLTYDGLFLEIYRAASTGTDLLQEIRISSAKRKIKWDLNVGASKAHVRKMLGAPSPETPDTWTYTCREGYEDYVKFHFKGDIAAEIEWGYWID
jgi:hypothetical protein